MFELSLHILDILENSLRAGADRIEISILESTERDLLEIIVVDDGEGMEKELEEKALDPFTTTKKKRKQVGLGLPLFKALAEHCDGNFSLRSEPSEGTEVAARFRRSHIDRPPLGEMAATVISVLSGHPKVELVYNHDADDQNYNLDTQEIQEYLDQKDLNDPRVLQTVKRDLHENLQEIRPPEYLGESAEDKFLNDMNDMEDIEQYSSLSEGGGK